MTWCMNMRRGIALVLFLFFALALPAAAQPAGRPDPEPRRGARPLEGSLKAGDPAPDFALKRLLSDSEKEKGAKPPKPVRLSDLKGKKPVVLVFGSYT